MKNRIPQSALALATGLSVRQIQRLASDGVMPRPGGRAGYSIDGAISALGKLVAHFQKKSEVSDELTELRLRKARADADVAEMKRDMMVEDLEWLIHHFESFKAKLVSRVCGLKGVDEKTQDRILELFSQINQECVDEATADVEAAGKLKGKSTKSKS